MNRSPSRILIGAAAAFTVALFLFGSALLRALSAGDVLLPTPAQFAPQGADRDGHDEERRINADALQLAVDNDPFSPARERSANRYRLPGDVDPEPEPTPPPPPPPPAFRVSGTMITEGGSYALIGVGDAPPLMLRVGDRSLGYRLTNVTPETATMSNDENTIMLNVPAPAQSVAQASTGTARPGQNRVTGAQGALIQQLLERARAAGMEGAALERLIRSIEGIDPRNIEALEVLPDGFNVRAAGANIMLRGDQMQIQRGGAATPQRPTPPGVMTRPRPDTTELRMQRTPDLR